MGFEYKWWNTLPTNMETTVLSGINFEYKGMTGKGLPDPDHTPPAPCTPTAALPASRLRSGGVWRGRELSRPHIPWKVPLYANILPHLSVRDRN